MQRTPEEYVKATGKSLSWTEGSVRYTASPISASGVSVSELSAQSGPSAVSRESLMVVIERNDEGTPTVWCDPEIVDLVTALNKGGIRTVASCSGHGVYNGNVALADGRELIIALNFEEARAMEKKLLNTSPAEPSALELRAEEAMRGISEMIRLRMTRSPAISQMEEWMETINVLLAAALKDPPAGARDAVTDADVARALDTWFEAASNGIRPEDQLPDQMRRMRAAIESTGLTGKADGGCKLGCADQCKAELHGVPSECPDLSKRPATQPAAPYKLTDDDLEIV